MNSCEGLHRQRGVDHQHVGRAADHADGCEILDRVVGQLARGRAGAVRGHVALHQRVAVGRGAGRGLGRDHAAAAALVVHDEALLEQGAPALGHRAAHHVAAAAGSHRHDVADGFGRPGGLRPGQARGRPAGRVRHKSGCVVSWACLL